MNESEQCIVTATVHSVRFFFSSSCSSFGNEMNVGGEFVYQSNSVKLHATEEVTL